MDRSNSESLLRRLGVAGQSVVLEEMAAGVAHELNQSLAAIATFSHAGERMLERPAPLVARAAEVFRDISREALGAGDRLQAIRRSMTRARSPYERCQVSDLVVEMRPILDGWAAHFGCAVMLDDGVAVPDVEVDRLKIQHVVLTLVRNSLEACADLPSPREIRIDITDRSHTVEVGVTDPGPPLAAEVSAHLFEPFFSTKPHGAGLGLASSRSVVESHEGSIGFSSLSSGGVRFWFRLPVALPEE